jgi:membrane protease YdiL (CAAX protease family)
VQTQKSNYVRAHGSLTVVSLSPAQIRQRAIEIVLLYGGMPLIVTYAVHVLHIALFILLQPVLLTLVLILFFDKTYSLKRELTRPFSRHVFFSIVTLFVIIGTLLTVLTAGLMPDIFLNFPRERPQLWRLVMLLYPFLSVFAQELVYRPLFFHRYGVLFNTWRLTIAVNAIAFSFGHIVLGNLMGMVGTGLIGLLFAWRYLSSGSFWAVWLEHSLYGCLIFTLGLGKYFYSGVSAFTH